MATAPDASGNGHDGTYHGASTTVTGLISGDADGAAQVRSATDDYIVENDTITPGTFSTLTIGGVIQWHASTANQAICFGIDDVATAQVGFYVDSAQHVAFIFTGDSGTGSSLAGTTPLSADTTYDVVCTWDGMAARIYLDGVLEAAVGFSGALTIAEALQFYAGTDQFDTTGHFEFDGILDELFCSFTHAASAGEVTAIHDARTGSGSIATAVGAVSPLIYWRLGTSTPTPSVSTGAPNSGGIAGGTSVVLRGTYLTGATAVTFGATAAASFTVDSDSQITAVSPAHAAGSVTVTVTTPGGTS